MPRCNPHLESQVFYSKALGLLVSVPKVFVWDTRDLQTCGLLEQPVEASWNTQRHTMTPDIETCHSHVPLVLFRHLNVA